MEKLNPLDLINNNFFESDIVSCSGELLHKVGEAITPEIILKLYYQDTYKKTAQKEGLVEKTKATTSQTQSEEINLNSNYKKEEAQNNLDITLTESRDKVETADRSELIINESFDDTEKGKSKSLKTEHTEVNEDLEQIPLEFNEKHANKVMELSMLIANEIGLDDDRLKELQKASYYFNIGVSRQTTEDLKKPDYIKRKAEAGYKILKEEMELSENIAQAALYFEENYDSTTFKIHKAKFSDIPYHHIIAITNYYIKLITKGYNIGESLKIMLRMGGSKFNIFILHKFIRIMRSKYE